MICLERDYVTTRDSASGQVLNSVKIKESEETLSFGAFSADGAFLVASCWKDGQVVRIVDCYTGATKAALKPPEGARVRRAAIAKDGKRLVLASADGLIRSLQV